MMMMVIHDFIIYFKFNTSLKSVAFHYWVPVILNAGLLWVCLRVFQNYVQEIQDAITKAIDEVFLSFQTERKTPVIICWISEQIT